MCRYKGKAYFRTPDAAEEVCVCACVQVNTVGWEWHREARGYQGPINKPSVQVEGGELRVRHLAHGLTEQKD